MIRSDHRRLIVAASPLFLAVALRPAQAELQVRLPEVEYRELEFEHNGFFSFDKNPSLGGQQSYTNSIGYGVTPWWEVELEGESNSVPDSSVHYTATTMENTFQITEPGKYMFNLGAFAEYHSQRYTTNRTASPLVPSFRRSFTMCSVWTASTR